MRILIPFFLKNSDQKMNTWKVKQLALLIRIIQENPDGNKIITGEAFLSEFQSKFFSKIQMAIRNTIFLQKKRIPIGRQ